MTAGAKAVSELLMMVLALIAGPVDSQEFRLDMIGPSGKVESLLVKRTTEGFQLYQERGDKRQEAGTLREESGNSGTFVFKAANRPEQKFNLSSSLQNFSVDKLRTARQLDLTTSDKGVIHVYRSGNVVYLTPEKGRVTYVCH
jgi:hypothetical protein